MVGLLVAGDLLSPRNISTEEEEEIVWKKKKVESYSRAGNNKGAQRTKKV